MQWMVIAGITGVSLLWLAWLFQSIIADYFGIFWHVPSAGALGDTFGALNALFSALAVIGVLVTLILQRRQLAEQEKEVRDQRSRLESQERTQHLARFDATFFQLLGLLRELREGAEVRFAGRYAGKETLRGASAIEHYATRLDDKIREGKIDVNSKFALGSCYRSLVHEHAEARLSPFFRIIYTMLRRISEDKIMTKDEKAVYGNLLRSQLTSHDLVLIGFNGLIKEAKNLSSYIDEFRLLKYLPKNEIRHALQKHYPKEAFAARD